MNTTLSSIEPSKLLSTERIWNILADQDETCDERRVCYYPNIETLARQVRSSKCWTMGEVFVYVESAHRFIVMKQIAPSSCEMLTICQAGYCDVLTAYRYTQEELVASLNEYLVSLPSAFLRSYFGVMSPGALSHFLTVFLASPVLLQISPSESWSRHFMRLTLPIMSMVITSYIPAEKISRAVEHPCQFWIGTRPFRLSDFGRRQHLDTVLSKL